MTDTPPEGWPTNMEYGLNPIPQPPSLPDHVRSPLYGFRAPDKNWYIYRYEIVLRTASPSQVYKVVDYSTFDFDQALRGVEPDSKIIVGDWLILNENRFPIREILVINKRIVPVDVERAKTL